MAAGQRAQREAARLRHDVHTQHHLRPRRHGGGGVGGIGRRLVDRCGDGVGGRRARVLRLALALALALLLALVVAALLLLLLLFLLIVDIPLVVVRRAVGVGSVGGVGVAHRGDRSIERTVAQAAALLVEVGEEFSARLRLVVRAPRSLFCLDEETAGREARELPVLSAVGVLEHQHRAVAPRVEQSALVLVVRRLVGACRRDHRAALRPEFRLLRRLAAVGRRLAVGRRRRPLRSLLAPCDRVSVGLAPDGVQLPLHVPPRRGRGGGGAAEPHEEGEALRRRERRILGGCQSLESVLRRAVHIDRAHLEELTPQHLGPRERVEPPHAPRRGGRRRRVGGGALVVGVVVAGRAAARLRRRGGGGPSGGGGGGAAAARRRRQRPGRSREPRGGGGGRGRRRRRAPPPPTRRLSSSE